MIDARAVIRGSSEIDPHLLERSFSVRTNDGFVASYGAKLASIIATQAPRVRLRFAAQGDEDVAAVREGRVDLDIGVVGAMGPEIRLQALFHDHYIGVVRRGHPLSKSSVTVAAYCQYPLISVSRRGRYEGPIDAKLKEHNLSRRVSLSVSNFADALMIARTSDYIASVPKLLTQGLCDDLRPFDLPVRTPKAVISMAWHPRFDADPTHRWLRARVKEAVKA